MRWKKYRNIYSSQESTFKQTAQGKKESSLERELDRATRTVRQSARYGEAKAIGAIVVRLVGTILGQRRFEEATLLMQWSVIVGHKIAAMSLPIRLTFHRGIRENGILHLKVANGSFAVELQHHSALLIERINAYFDRPIVGQIRITQGALPHKLSTPLLSSPRQIILPPAEEAALLAELASVHDNTLREALIRLGRYILYYHHQQNGVSDSVENQNPLRL